MMQFLISDTFTDSLGKLTGEEQKVVKLTAFEMQMSPDSKGLSYHRLDKSKDKNFWSVRANRDIRLIVHRTGESMLLCYVDHHDKAYAWAERRKLETHPKTGAAQLVEVRETVTEVVVPIYVERKVDTAPGKASSKVLFASTPEDDLLACGVPPDWIPEVRRATEDSFFELIGHLPAEAAEALFDLAAGGVVKPVAKPPVSNPFAHPDALRRFRLMSNVEELSQALEFPWDKWATFLHPDQRQTVERDYAGPARVAGSAGTGKTIVALHRTAHLAKTNPEASLLLTTYSDPLANALRGKLRRLLGNAPKLFERVEVASLPTLGRRLHTSRIGPVALADGAVIRGLVAEAAASVPTNRFSLPFLLSEWEHVVDAWQLTDWESYRDVTRLGRKMRLTEAQRTLLWSIYERVRASLAGRVLMTEAAMFAAVTASLVKEGKTPFDFAVVDEAQDLSVAHVRFLAAIGGGRPNALFFAGDLGQRIFQQPFSWKTLGVDVRGRSRTLRVNYRTSHQIRSQADRLLGASFSDVDSVEEKRDDTVSVFNGPPPVIQLFSDADHESAAVSDWLRARRLEGVLPGEMGVFVRSPAQLGRATDALKRAELSARVLDESLETHNDHVSVGTMHLAKGLEFRAVVVMACDEDVVPLKERLDEIVDPSDHKDAHDTERQLLYVACTRARDHLLVTAVEPGSEFLLDLETA